MRFFREIITVFAGLVALLLIAALAGPYLIDWNKHKPVIVETLQRATGAKITVAGDIDLKLLPSPQLRLGKVSVAGQKPGGPSLQADALHMEIGLTALLRGQVRFVEAALQKPRIGLTMQPDGALVLPDIPEKRAVQIAFEHVALRDAIVTVNRGPDAKPLVISGVSLEASGQTLSGPFRGNGSVLVHGVPVRYSFNTGSIEGSSIRTKFVTEAIGPVSRGEFDGRLQFAAGAAGGRALSFEGSAAVTGQTDLPDGSEQAWRVQGPLVINASGIKSEAFELRSGEEERAFAATGSLDARFALLAARQPASVQVQLAAERINIDAIFAGEGGPKQALARFVAALGRLVSQRQVLPDLPVSARAGLTIAALSAGGETLNQLSLSARLDPGKAPVMELKTGAPGSTRVELAGTLETGIAPVFRGSAVFATRDMRRLENWLGPALPQAGRMMSALPYRSFRLSSKADISKAGISARDLKIETGRSRFDGAIVYTGAISKERAKLHVDLVSPALDIDGLGDLTAPARAIGDMDFYVAFDARATRLARFGKGIVDAGNIVVRMERSAGKLQVSQFDIKNLGGANVTAKGELLDGQARAAVVLDAKNLVELSQLLQRIAPGPAAQVLASRAAALSPAKLNIQLSGSSFALRGGKRSVADGFSVSSLEVDGDVNGTKVQVRSSAKGERVGASGTLNLKAAQSAILLRQLGLEALSLSGMAGSTIEAQWKPAPGKPSGGQPMRSAVVLKANLAGTQFSFDGEARKFLPDPDVRGKLSVKTRDAAPLLQLLAFALPNLSVRAPVDMSADFAWKGSRLAAGSLRGILLGARSSGHLVLAPRKLDKQISRYFLKGDLRLDQVSLRGLTALVFGPDEGTGSMWRTSSFNSASGDFPPGEITVQTGRFDLPGGAAGQSARFVMRLSPGLMVLDELAMTAGKTALSGKLTFRKDKATAAVSGTLAFRAPQLGLRGMSGSSTGEIEFAATGNSERELVAGLAGKGKVTIKNLKMEGADTRAMQRVLKATDAERLELTESGVRAALRKNFADAPLGFDSKTFSITIAGGAARIATGQLKDLPGDVDGDLSATFDLRSLTGLAKLELVARKRPKDWNGALPAVALERVLQSSAAEGKAGRVAIRAAGFVNGVSARAIVREVARMEALEFDIRERAYFNRRIKAAAFLVQRRSEIQAYKTEQARLAEEARKRAEEEARKRAAEEAQRKAEEERRLLEAERKRKAEEARAAAAEERKKAIDARKAKIAARRAALAKAAAEKKAAARKAAEKARRLQSNPVSNGQGAPIRQVAPAGVTEPQ